MKLQDAIDSLYNISVVQGKKTAPNRLQKLAEYCIQELDKRGLVNAETEKVIPGGGRPKNWDLGWKYQDKYRLAISMKSILRNIPGTVPNRIDDLIGEVTNIQMFSPEITTGYLMVFDVSKDAFSKKHGSTWCELLENRLNELSGRCAPAWSTGMLETFKIIKVNFTEECLLLTDESELSPFFDTLEYEVKKRNPSLLND